MIENNQISNIANDQLPQIQGQQQQIRDEQLPQRQNEQQENLGHDEQQQQRPQQIPQIFERQQQQQRQDEGQQQQIPNVQRPLNRQEQRPRQPNEQQGAIEEQIPDEQQQQQQMPQRRRQYEQEPQIPDEVRQMPDAQQQEMLRRILRQELHQFQRPPNNNNTTLISIFASIIVAILIALLLRSPMDYVPRKEFEAYKAESQNGLVAVRENSRKSISEHEAKIVNFGKEWEETIKNMMRPNATVKELPDKSIENLLQANKKSEAEVFKLRTELSNLKKEVSGLQNMNIKLYKSLDSVKDRLQNIESMNEGGWFKSFIIILISIVVSVGIVNIMINNQ